MFDVRFWMATLERALKTLAQALVALIGANAVSVMDLDWGQMLGVSATAALVSILTSVISAPLGNTTGPSLGPETVEPDPIIVEEV
jgi:hypothetical protein